MNRRALLRSPLLHCLLVGGLLFFVGLWLYPPKLGVVAAPGEAQLQALQTKWVQQMGRLPDQREKALILESVLDENILVAEALRLELHKGDPVIQRRLLQDAGFLGLEGEPEALIKQAEELGFAANDVMIRRRLIQRMEAAVTAGFQAQAPDDAVLRERYEASPERWRIPARLSFSHRFFSVDRSGDPAARARQALRSGDEGDPFLHGRQWELMSERSLASTFGYPFAEALLAVAPAASGWVGPLGSSYGMHLVKVSEYRPPASKPFESVTEQLQRGWLREQRQQHFSEFKRRLRQRYDILGLQREDVAALGPG